MGVSGPPSTPPASGSSPDAMDQLAAELGVILSAAVDWETGDPGDQSEGQTLGTELRSQTLRAATAARKVGTPLSRVSAITASETFLQTVEQLDALLQDLSDKEWRLPAHQDYGTVHAVVTHLVGIDEVVLATLQRQPLDKSASDHFGAGQPAMEELSEMAAADLRARWRSGANALLQVAAVTDPAEWFPLHDLGGRVDDLLLLRSFELWAHADDIARATGRPRPTLDPSRARKMSAALVDAVPLVTARPADAGPGTIRIVLTGPGGGTYQRNVPPGVLAGPLKTGSTEGPSAVVVGDVVDVCRLAARRVGITELDLVVEGDADLAGSILEAVKAFARD